MCVTTPESRQNEMIYGTVCIFTYIACIYRAEIFRTSRPALGPTQPSVKLVPGLSRAKVRPGRAADHSLPSSAAVMEV